MALDAKEQRLLEWLLTPEGQRTPATKAALAAELEVHESTLRSWEKRYHFEQEYNRQWRRLRGGLDNVKRVVDKLHEKALAGDNQAMKLYLEWAKELKREDETPTAPDLRDLSDADLMEGVKALVDQPG